MPLLITWCKDKENHRRQPSQKWSEASQVSGWGAETSFQTYLINNTHYRLKSLIWLGPAWWHGCVGCVADIPALHWWCHAWVWGNLSSWLMDLVTHCQSRQFKGQHVYQLFMSVLTNLINHYITSTQVLSPQHSMNGHLTIRLPAILTFRRNWVS